MGLRLPNLLSKRKAAYERMLEGLTNAGYVVKSTPECEVLGRPTPGSVAVIYLDPFQDGSKPPTEYTIRDVLRDRPQELLVTDMDKGKSSWLRLK